MKGFNDFRCKKCGAGIGWFGELTEAPPCARCGHQIDPEAIQRTEKELNRLRAQIDAELEQEAHDAMG